HTTEYFNINTHQPSSIHFPYTTLFRSRMPPASRRSRSPDNRGSSRRCHRLSASRRYRRTPDTGRFREASGLVPPRNERPRQLERSEEHTSELQSRFDIVCRLLLEKKNN